MMFLFSNYYNGEEKTEKWTLNLIILHYYVHVSSIVV